MKKANQHLLHRGFYRAFAGGDDRDLSYLNVLGVKTDYPDSLYVRSRFEFYEAAHLEVNEIENRLSSLENGWCNAHRRILSGSFKAKDRISMVVCALTTALRQEESLNTLEAMIASSAGALSSVALSRTIFNQFIAREEATWVNNVLKTTWIEKVEEELFFSDIPTIVFDGEGYFRPWEMPLRRPSGFILPLNKDHLFIGSLDKSSATMTIVNNLVKQHNLIQFFSSTRIHYVPKEK